jgi:hypothetical protein
MEKVPRSIWVMGAPYRGSKQYNGRGALFSVPSMPAWTARRRRVIRENLEWSEMRKSCAREAIKFANATPPKWTGSVIVS